MIPSPAPGGVRPSTPLPAATPRPAAQMPPSRGPEISLDFNSIAAPAKPPATAPAPAAFERAPSPVAPQSASPVSAPVHVAVVQTSGIGASGPVFNSPALPIDDLLRKMLSLGDGVSDLFFVVGRPPQVENFGKLIPVEGTAYTPGFQPQQTEGLARTLVNDSARLLEDLRNTGSCDCSYSVEGLARFRVNIFKQKGSFAMVLRKLNTKIPSMADLKLPPVFQRIIQEKTGLVFITGATGSGKTTTLAAMLNEMNETMSAHIVTLEDPVEFLHPHKNATFCQREMGKDFSSFSMGLRAALRQAPKVILVGEIRDRETMEIALTAAETGHVVYSTLHTISAGQAINRVLGMFSKEEEQQVRERLAETLRWVCSQRLAPKIGGGRVMVPEIMGSNLRSREAIQLGENENRNYNDIIAQARQEGWCTFEQSLAEAFENNLITEETAMLLSVSKNRMRQAIDRILKSTGRDVTTTDAFKLRHGEEEQKKIEHQELIKKEVQHVQRAMETGTAPEVRTAAKQAASVGADLPPLGLKLKG
jgi:twitching motility protein PilT